MRFAIELLLLVGVCGHATLSTSAAAAEEVDQLNLRQLGKSKSSVDDFIQYRQNYISLPDINFKFVSLSAQTAGVSSLGRAQDVDGESAFVDTIASAGINLVTVLNKLEGLEIFKGEIGEQGLVNTPQCTIPFEQLRHPGRGHGWGRTTQLLRPNAVGSAVTANGLLALAIHDENMVVVLDLNRCEIVQKFDCPAPNDVTIDNNVMYIAAGRKTGKFFKGRGGSLAKVQLATDLESRLVATTKSTLSEVNYLRRNIAPVTAVESSETGVVVAFMGDESFTIDTRSDTEVHFGMMKNEGERYSLSVTNLSPLGHGKFIGPAFPTEDRGYLLSIISNNRLARAVDTFLGTITPQEEYSRTWDDSNFHSTQLTTKQDDSFKIAVCQMTPGLDGEDPEMVYNVIDVENMSPSSRTFTKAAFPAFTKFVVFNDMVIASSHESDTLMIMDDKLMIMDGGFLL